MKRKTLVGVLAISLFLLVSATGAFWFWEENRAVEDSQTVQFRISAGEPLSTTAQRLQSAKLIRNALLFRVIFQVGQGEGAVPSGTFLIPGGMTAREAADYLHHATPLQIRVTVPEGWTSSKIARLLEEKQVVSAEQFMAVVRNPSRLGSLAEGLTSLDGRLFPETYLFSLDTPPEEVARIFLQTFKKRTARWEALFSRQEWDQRVILASIVEREYRDSSEAPLIASVFANRLSHGIPLASCATIEYILTEIQGRPHPRRIFFIHTEISSPYNTYLNKGLPPTAIANPGLTALQAAFEPAPTNYLYFVLADAQKGTHTFSSNYASHLKAREAYLNSYVTKG